MKVSTAVLERSGASLPFADSRPIRIIKTELGKPRRDEVLVKIAAAGVCHSDLAAITGKRPRPLPVALGHEASAIVVEVGDGVTNLEKGDHVVMSFLPTCGECPMCATGRASLCEPGYKANAAGTLLSGHKPFSINGQSLNHHSGVSAFTEYTVVSKHSVVKIDQDVDLVHAALFGCAVMTGVGVVMNTCKVRPGESVAIIGLGGVGMAAVLGAVASGASKIIAVDLKESKLEAAKNMGATHCYLADDADVVSLVRDAAGDGVDYAIELAGVHQAFDLAYKVTKRGGVTSTAGLSSSKSNFEVSPLSLVGEERVIKGSYMGSCIPSRDIPRYIELFKLGKLPVDKLLSSTGPLSDINKAFDNLVNGDVIRHVIIP